MTLLTMRPSTSITQTSPSTTTTSPTITSASPASPSNSHKKLFTPIRVGNMHLKHRVVMSPLTRIRCPGSLPTELVAEYYAQRATEGGLLISEGMHPSIMAGNFLDVPSMYSPEHARAWKDVTDAVHEKGGFMACQLWHTGRFAVSPQLGGRPPLSASATNAGLSNRFAVTGRVPNEQAREMTVQDIKDTVADHVHAAKCAIAAGFDCVEITSANGYLFDQFLNDKTNLRTDAYGGSISNRSRFTLEVLDAVIAAIGAERVSVRFSPWGMVLMELDSDPIALFSHVLGEVEKRGVAYVCLTQPRTDLFMPEKMKWGKLSAASEGGKIPVKVEDINLAPFLRVLKTTPKFTTGNYDAANCWEEVEQGEIDAVTFGRWFISNPDLVARLRQGRELAPSREGMEGWYADGKLGYTDYPVWGEEVKM